MSVDYAILGLLSVKPMSGYDLKKIMQDSLYMYWSGNNNQIYKALLQLYSDGLLTGEILHREGAPSKKIYSITDKGRLALEEWICSTPPEAPEFKKPFLVQIAWAGNLEPSRLQELVRQYQQELDVELKLQQEKYRRRNMAANTSQQAIFIENMIFDNIVAFYESEIAWTQRFLKGLQKSFSKE